MSEHIHQGGSTDDYKQSVGYKVKSFFKFLFTWRPVDSIKQVVSNLSAVSKGLSDEIKREVGQEVSSFFLWIGRFFSLFFLVWFFCQFLNFIRGR